MCSLQCGYLDTIKKRGCIFSWCLIKSHMMHLELRNLAKGLPVHVVGAVVGDQHPDRHVDHYEEIPRPPTPSALCLRGKSRIGTTGQLCFCALRATPERCDVLLN